jgi:glyoxylase-like metal-dependent hydrolase (beta-lactamase superfamily II)/8-oxo-dGTP pyrophosphatase MutT (NUDIX family)
MSELPEGIAPAIPSTPIDSAVVAAVRPGPDGWDLLLGLRSRRSRFFPSHWACPGGRVEPVDRPDDPGAFVRCGARELLEETGLRVAPGDLHPIGVRTTPPFMKLRYHSAFFLAVVPPGTEPPGLPSPDEVEELCFVPAREAVARWEAGTMPAPPPLPPLFRSLAAAPPSLAPVALAAHLLADHEADAAAPRIEVAHDVWFYPVATATLPPATHTNVWMPGGTRFVIIDPGCDDPDELEALLAVIARRRALTASEPRAVLLTHHHRDHAAGACAVARALRVPVLAHPETLARVPLDADLDARPTLTNGTRLDLGGMTLVAHHTPGHAPGHIVLEIEGRSLLIAGDLVSGMSTILLPLGDGGDVGAYLASLQRTRALGASRLLPAHGPALDGGALARALAHRSQREAQVALALGPAARSLEEIAREAYADTPDAPPALARMQALAHLVHLEQRGDARRADPEGWDWSAV